jgi:hypothetical protein
MRRHGQPRRERRNRDKNPQDALHFDRPMSGRGAIKIKILDRSINVEAAISVA